MNVFKRCLSMFLAICLLFSAVPMTVWAEEAEGTEPPAITEAPVETEAPAGTEGTEDVPEETTGEPVKLTSGGIDPEAGPVDVTIRVGESTQPLFDNSGNYQNDENNVDPDGNIATMVLIGSDGTPGEIVFTETDRDKITFRDLCAENTDTWVASQYGIAVAGNKYLLYVIRKESGGWYDFYFGYLKDGTMEEVNSQESTSNTYCSTEQVDNTITGSDAWGDLESYTIYQAAQGEGVQPSTAITFTGVARGETYAVVGNTTYNITVLPRERTVDIELEAGETFTYLDTTGRYESRDDHTEPDGSCATMDVKDSAVPVTALESGKSYLIVNKNTGDVLTDTVIAVPGRWDNKTGLDTIGKLSLDSTELWTITATDSGHTVVQDGKYLTIAGYYANMSDTETNLTLTYTENGWMILDGETTQNVPNVGSGSYYLSDNVGDGYSGGALGRNDTNNDYVYWDIYDLSPATKVTFTGMTPDTTTTAHVGYTTYNITVVAQKVDDEVANTRTDRWTVDPEIQEGRIAAATVENTGYADACWNAYETALAAARNKIFEVTSAVYTSEQDAQAALDALKTVVDALESAKAALVPGKAITIRYWRWGEVVQEETILVPQNAHTYDLHAQKTVNGTEYTLSPTTLNMVGNVTEFDILLLREGDASEGIMGSTNIGATKLQGKPVREMTVTAGISYNLDLADILADGQTAEWSVEAGKDSVAIVDPTTGVVTAKGDGIATITVDIKNQDGSVVKTYETTITVFPGVTGNVATREVAIYVDKCKNTTATCVLYANGAANEFNDGKNKFSAFRVFDVAEGELIYGAFQRGADYSVSNFTDLTFFGDPDDKHALAFMSSTNSAGEYMPLHDSQGRVVADNGDKLGEKYYISSYGSAPGLYKGLNGGTAHTGYSDAIWTGQIIPMAQYFADLHYDGAMGFNRLANEGDINTNLSFSSEPLPEINKMVDGVLPKNGKFANYQRYVPDMVAAVGEMVFFKITITLDRPTEWEPAKDANDNIIKDANGNIVPATDEYGKLSAITFNTATLLDNKLESDPNDTVLDAYFYTKELDLKDDVWDGVVIQEHQTNEQDLTEALNRGWADNETQRKLEFYLVYTIVPDDIPKFTIENVANLSYSYHSEYSTGTTSAEAPAKATITVIGEAMDNVVIDFGQTIVYTGLTNVHLKGAFVDEYDENGQLISQCKAEADYGTVTVTREQIEVEGSTEPQYEYTVTYTPTAILQGPDMVRIYGIGENGTEKIINGFIVYPATTVYYEEGFAFPNWNGEDEQWSSNAENPKYWNMAATKRASAEQTLEKLGKAEKNGNVSTIVSGKKNPYGFDLVYNDTAAINGSYAETSTLGAQTKFTFTGKGIQVFANCTPDSGYVSVEVREASSNQIVRLSMVNTKVLAGQTGATSGQTGDMDGLPVVSLINIQNMRHGRYIVTITKIMDSRPVQIDGIRIFNTLEPQEDSSPFTIDLEDHPSFYELRDVVLHSVGVDESTSEDYKKLAEQIYSKISGACALITDEKVAYATSDTVQDLLDKGPKNELFLYAGQSLTFKVTTDRCMQVGLKAPQGTTRANIKVETGGTTVLSKTPDVSSAVDMFYDLVKAPAENSVEYTVTIRNDGAGILSVTLLKICDDPQAAFEQLTREDIEKVLTAQNAPITILSQPVDAEVKMGERFNVEVVAMGEGLQYRWYYRNAGSAVWQKSSVKDNTYDDVMTSARAGREVYCVITDAAGNSVTTNTVKLIAKPETTLMILQQPTDAAAKMGERYCVEVIATGEDLQYRWFFRNGSTGEFHQSGVTDNTYDDVMTMARAGREVYCVITDSAGRSVTTNTVKLIALPRISLEIVQQPADSAARMGERFCVEVIAMGENLKYQWYYRNAGSVEFVASGVKDNTYDDVMTNARAGREVYCVITDGYGNSVTTASAKVALIPKETLEILQQPVSAEAKMGLRYCVEVIAKGDGLRYTWYYRNAGTDVWHKSGVTDNTYDDVMTKARAGREVYCVITDICGNQVITETVKLIALAEETLEILQQPVDAVAMLGERYCVEVLAKGDGLRYTWYFRNLGSGVWYKSGITDNTYDDVMTKARAGREVYCVISDACGNTVTTEIVTLVCIKEPQMVTVN